MQHCYSLRFARLCPVDDTTIRYDLQLQAQQKIMAEDIVAVCCGSVATFQEDLAECVAETFAFASGRLTAKHGAVKIVSRWEPL